MAIITQLKKKIRFKIIFGFLSHSRIKSNVFCSARRFINLMQALRILVSFKPKKLREKSRKCHNHKPQPFPDPRRKRKPTNLNKHKPNKRTKSTKISSLFPKRGNRNTKRTEKHKNKMHTERHTTNRLVE